MAQEPVVKKGKGRALLPPRLIEDADARLLTFNKRRVGLMDLGYELGQLTGVDVMVFIQCKTRNKSKMRRHCSFYATDKWKDAFAEAKSPMWNLIHAVKSFDGETDAAENALREKWQPVLASLQASNKGKHKTGKVTKIAQGEMHTTEVGYDTAGLQDEACYRIGQLLSYGYKDDEIVYDCACELHFTGSAPPAADKDNDGEEEAEDEEAAATQKSTPKKAAPASAAKSGTRKYAGRQCIPIKYIEDENKRLATYYKRRRTLYLKAFELSRFTGARVFVAINSKIKQTQFCYYLTEGLRAVVPQASIITHMRSLANRQLAPDVDADPEKVVGHPRMGPTRVSRAILRKQVKHTYAISPFPHTGEMGCALHTDENFPEQAQADYSVNFLYNEQHADESSSSASLPAAAVSIQAATEALIPAAAPASKKRKKPIATAPPPTEEVEDQMQQTEAAGTVPMEMSQEDIIALYRTIQRQVEAATVRPGAAADPKQKAKDAFCAEIRKKQALAASRQKNVDLALI